MTARYAIMKPRHMTSGNQTAASPPVGSLGPGHSTPIERPPAGPEVDARAERRSVLLWAAVALAVTAFNWRAEILAVLLGLLQIAEAFARACMQVILAAVFLAAFLRFFLAWFLAWLQVAFIVVGGFLFVLYAMVHGSTDKPRPPQVAPAGARSDGALWPAAYGPEARRGPSMGAVPARND